MKTVFLCFIVLVFGSCYTSKQAGKEVRKAHDKFPAVTAKIYNELYPIIIKTISDTVTVDSLVIVECPDSTIITEVITNNDTIRTVTVKREKVYVNVPAKTIYITEYKIDSAALAACILEHDSYVSKSQKETNKLSGKVKFWQGVSIALFLIALVLGFLLGRKFK